MSAAPGDATLAGGAVATTGSANGVASLFDILTLNAIAAARQQAIAAAGIGLLFVTVITTFKKSMQTLSVSTLLLVAAVLAAAAGASTTSSNIRTQNSVAAAMPIAGRCTTVFLILILIVATLIAGLSRLLIEPDNPVAAKRVDAVGSANILLIVVAIVAFFTRVLHPVAAAIERAAKATRRTSELWLTSLKAGFTRAGIDAQNAVTTTRQATQVGA
jgi:hypothetical protein